MSHCVAILFRLSVSENFFLLLLYAGIFENSLNYFSLVLVKYPCIIFLYMFIDKSDLNHNFRVFVRVLPWKCLYTYVCEFAYLSILALKKYIYSFHNFKLTICFYGYL